MMAGEAPHPDARRAAAVLEEHFRLALAGERRRALGR